MTRREFITLQRRNFYRSPKGEPFSGVGGYTPRRREPRGARESNSPRTARR
jgi:hypothetical protein